MTPQYAQLAQSIREGGFKPHEALPSERLLSEGLALSRVTARKAIDRLVEQGLILCKRGSGNDIAPQLEQPLTAAAAAGHARLPQRRRRDSAS